MTDDVNRAQENTILDGRYKILEIAGQGAMGTVYRGRDTRLNRDVALKCILQAPFKQSRENAIREARTLASLKHSSLVHIYDVIAVDEKVWIITEWLEGQNLATVTLPLSPLAVMAIMVQVFEALAEAHDAQIFHRDIKPSNIMMCNNGRVILIDFGVAFTPGFSSGETIAGSLRYTDPRLLEGKAAGEATDLFSAALVMLELCHGEAVLPDLAPLPLFRYAKEELEPRLEEFCDGLYPPLAYLAKKFVSKQKHENKNQETFSAREAAQVLRTEISKFSNLSPERLLADGPRSSLLKNNSHILAIAKAAIANDSLTAKERARWMCFYEKLCEQGVENSLSLPPSERKNKWKAILFGIIIAVCVTAAFAFFSNNKKTEITEVSSAETEKSEALISFETAVPSSAPTENFIETPLPETTLTLTATPPPPTPTLAPVKKVLTKTPVAPIPKTEVIFVSNAWANIKIDGNDQGKLPRARPFLLKPGSYQVELESPLVERALRTVEVPQTRGVHRVFIKLEPKSANHLLVLKSEATLFIDGQNYGKVSSKWLRLSYGVHEAVLKRGSAADLVKTFTIDSSSPSQIFLE